MYTHQQSPEVKGLINLDLDVRPIDLTLGVL